eukprot:CAMPEP_0118663358 /NCGR_PEP_ID=MMETSP0785-20121206/17374_1 /TAXON_ID=91992 /ORGANISM="Bolidomonas pacifica, Strain CCMP 1866" /LENGTH=77 /DNA_ID=CAMNT_0006557067 /DNA_START=38 /DNA_END=268 /DNA_ORIENTATION=-
MPERPTQQKKTTLTHQNSLGRLHNEFERGNEMMKQALALAKARQNEKIQKALAARRAKTAANAAAAFRDGGGAHKSS